MYLLTPIVKNILFFYRGNIIRTEDQSSQHDQHVNISSIYLDDNTQIENSIIIDNPPRCSTPSMLITHRFFCSI